METSEVLTACQQLVISVPSYILLRHLMISINQSLKLFNGKMKLLRSINSNHYTSHYITTAVTENARMPLKKGQTLSLWLYSYRLIYSYVGIN